MEDLNFKKYLFNEWGKDLFGFDSEDPIHNKGQKGKFYTPVNPEKPINTFNVERVCKRIAEFSIQDKEPCHKFVNEVEWGKGVGALKVIIHPDLHTEISRAGYDLKGEKTWCTKKLFLVNRAGYGGNEEFISQELMAQLKYVNEMAADSPNGDFKSLQGLVVSMANEMRKTSRSYFIYDSIRKLDENQYVIKFNLRAGGVEAPGQNRVIQNETVVSYDRKHGKIRMTNRNVESPMGGHNWAIMPSDTDAYFFPTQPKDEITKIIATTMRWY